MSRGGRRWPTIGGREGKTRRIGRPKTRVSEGERASEKEREREGEREREMERRGNRRKNGIVPVGDLSPEVQRFNPLSRRRWSSRVDSTLLRPNKVALITLLPLLPLRFIVEQRNYSAKGGRPAANDRETRQRTVPNQ